MRTSVVTGVYVILTSQELQILFEVLCNISAVVTLKVCANQCDTLQCKFFFTFILMKACKCIVFNESHD